MSADRKIRETVDAEAPSASNIIYNFGQPYPVHRVGDQRILLEGREFATNQQVIAKTRLSRTALQRRYPGTVTKITELASLPDGVIYGMTLGAHTDPTTFAYTLHNDKQIEYAQPDLLDLGDAGPAGRSQPSRVNAISKLPSAIQDFWETTTGSGVRIALIDDGFDFSHQELQDVRVVFSYDADLATRGATPKSRVDTHGTRVAGLIYARHDDEGIEGIAPDAELVAIRQADSWTSHLILAFTVADLAGADIINCSWTINYLPEALADALAAIIAGGGDGHGPLVVVSAGNQGGELSKHNPLSALPGIVTVGAFAPSSGERLPAHYSNSGLDLDLLAPSDLLSLSVIQEYHRFGGTSAATAVVSGTAALLLARDPSLSRTELLGKLHDLYPVSRRTRTGE